MPSHPIPSGSLTSDPLSSDPLPTDPLPSDPMPSDPMTGYSISSDSTPSDPIPSDPMADDTLPIDSIASDPMPSGSLPSEPMAGQPAPSDPVAAESVTPESVEPESLVSDSVPVSPSIANQISSPSLAKDPAPEDSPSNESLPSEPIPDPAASANIPFAEKASAADDFSDPSDNLAPADNPEVGPVSEEIAIPIAPPPENQEPAPAQAIDTQAIDSQAIDLRQIADQPPPTLSPDLPALAEPSPPLQRQIPIATAAPLVAPAEPKATKTESATAAGSNSATALPLQLINQLLRKIGATPLVSLADMLPLLRILILAVLAGIALRLANATLGAIDDLPLVGGLLELVGLVTLLNFLARNAFKQKKRAELLARIQKLRTDLLG